MAWIKVPSEHKPLFLAALPQDPRVQIVTMFGGLAAKVNGHVFAGLFARSVVVSLDEPGRRAALKLAGAASFDPRGNGRLRSQKIMLPEALVHERGALRRWVARAFATAVALPPKPAKAPSTRESKADRAASARPSKKASKPSAAERAFAKLVDVLAKEPMVEPPKPSRREFGSNALKVEGKIFAMLVRGRLVLKLPAQRVTALIDLGAGSPFDAGKGKPMKAWVVVQLPELHWLALAREARLFVQGR